MNVIAKIGSLFGNGGKKRIAEEQKRLLTLFRANREKASALIPEKMKSEFLSSVFSDKSLRTAIKESFAKQVGEDGYAEFLKLRVYYYLSAQGFGSRLKHFNVKSDDVAKIMIEGIDHKEP
jgi:hypothetical protein